MAILRRKDLAEVRARFNCPHLNKINLGFLCKCYWEVFQTWNVALTDESLSGWKYKFQIYLGHHSRLFLDFFSKMHEEDFLTMHKVTLKASLQFRFWGPQKNNPFNTAWKNA